MKILITGGAGFIGSHVVDSYISEGHDVAVLDNLSTGKAENVNQKARFYEADIRDAAALQSVFEAEKPDVVNHHAAQMSVPGSVEDPVFDADVNVMGLLNLLECSVAQEIERFIFIGSGGTYYGDTADLPIAEDRPASPQSPYAISKYVSEWYLDFYRQQHGLNYTALRYSNVYGPRQLPKGEAGVVAIFIEKLMAGEVPTIYHYPEQPEGMTRDYCFVQDVARANVLALGAGKGDAFNISTGFGTRTAELYRLILSTVRAEAGLAEGLEFDSPLKGPARPGDVRMNRISNEKAQRLIGWQPEHSLQKGIGATFKWFLQKV